MTAYAPPQTPLQTELVAVRRDMLRADHVGIDDDSFDVGGHSLLAIKMLARVHATTGVRLHLRRLAQEPTIRALAAAINATPRDETSAASTV
jgi:aryl carrier-like protein